MRAECKIFLSFLILGIICSITWHLLGPQGSTAGEPELAQQTNAPFPKSILMTKDPKNGGGGDVVKEPKRATFDTDPESDSEEDKENNDPNIGSGGENASKLNDSTDDKPDPSSVDRHNRVNNDCPHKEFLDFYFCEDCTFQPGNDLANNRTALNFFLNKYIQTDNVEELERFDGWGTVIFAGEHEGKYNWDVGTPLKDDEHKSIELCYHVENFPVVSCNYFERVCHLERPEGEDQGTTFGRVYQAMGTRPSKQWEDETGYIYGMVSFWKHVHRQDFQVDRPLHTFAEAEPSFTPHSKVEEDICPHKLFMKKHFCRTCTLDTTNLTTLEQSVREALTFTLNRPNWRKGGKNTVVMAGPAIDNSDAVVNPHAWARYVPPMTPQGLKKPDECFHQQELPTLTCTITQLQDEDVGPDKYDGVCFHEGSCKTHHQPGMSGHYKDVQEECAGPIETIPAMVISKPLLH